jgi:hypothetical protein
MLTIDLRGSKKKVATAVEEHSVELSAEIVNCVCDAIDKGISRVTTMVILTDTEVYSFTASRSFYEETLRANIIFLARAELYELCHKAKTYADRLTTKLLSDKIYLSN